MKLKSSSPLSSKSRFQFGIFLLLVMCFGSLTPLFASSDKPRKQTAKKTFAKKSNRKTGRKLSTSFPQPRAEDEFESDAEKREEWFMFRRTYPFGDLPENARRNAWERRPAEARSNRFGVAAQWRAIGPSPTNSYFPSNWGLTSGRINAIAVSQTNPNLVLIGAATGGVWRSVDGGNTFAPASDNQVDLAVGSIAFAPSNDSIVYAGMGDKAAGYLGTGVLKSTDGGQTWARVSNSTLPAPGRISKIEVDPTNPNRVYVAQYASAQGNSVFASGFWISNDGGVNWTKTISGLPRDLVRHPTQANTLYLAMQRVDNSAGPLPGGVFKSVDNGLTWTQVYTSPYASTVNIKVAVTPVAPQNVYVLVGGGSPLAARVEISGDEGASWTNRNSAFDVGQFSYNCYLFVHPTNPNIIFVGTRDLWRSVDGGATYINITNNFSITGSYNPFQAKSHPDQHHFYISPSDPNVIYLANDGGISKSTDGATTFQSLNASLALTMFVSLDLHPTDAARTYGGTQDNGTQKRNGTQSWREFATGDGGQTVIDAVDPSIVFTTYVRHAIYRYNNNGDASGGLLTNSTTFANDRVAFYPPFVNNGVDSTLYFGTYRLYASTNRGVNWTAPGGAQDLTLGGADVLSAIGVGKSNPNVIYTGSAGGRAMVSVNGGVNWSDITNGLPIRFIETIIVSPTDSNTAYLTVSGFGSGHVFKTTNAGATWTDISGNLPDIPTNTLLIDPRNSNTLYVGTDIGVFRSTVGGNVWETFNAGMPPTIVTELDAQEASGLIQAATYGRGAYEISLASARKVMADFDGDGKTDVSVFRPANGIWYVSNSSNSQSSAVYFGLAGDVIAPEDYDGDNRADYAIFRGGVWYVLNSLNGSSRTAQYGLAGDKPVAGDYDGDGKADLAVFRPSEGNWYVLQSSNSQSRTVNWGLGDDLPVPADYDGDGKTDIAVYRQSNGTWFVLRSSDNSALTANFGLSGDKPVVADYDNDGRADFAVYRPSEGNWYLQQTTAGFATRRWGASGDVPAQGDYDGDGQADFALFRPSEGNWYILQNASNSIRTANFGLNGDVPVPAGYNP